MYNPFFSHALSLVISVGGNLSLSWLFLRSLFFPYEHVEFIENTSVLIFIIEFMSICAGGFAMGLANQEKPPAERDPRIIMHTSVDGGGAMGPLKTKFLLLFVFSLTVFGVGLATGNLILPVIFFVGLIAKFFGQRASGGQGPERIAISIILLIFLLVLTSVPSFLWGYIFPFPPDIKPSGSGTFVDYPQGLILWGILYYLCLAVVDVAFYARLEKNFVWRPFYYISVLFLKIMTFVIKLHPQSNKLGGTVKFFQRAEAGGFDEFLKSVSAAQKVSSEQPNNTTQKLLK